MQKQASRDGIAAVNAFKIAKSSQSLKIVISN